MTHSVCKLMFIKQGHRLSVTSCNWIQVIFYNFDDWYSNWRIGRQTDCIKLQMQSHLNCWTV